MHNVKKLVRGLVQLLLSQTVFPMAPPSLIMKAWILQFEVNIQNPMEDSGMMMLALTIILNFFLHQIS